MTRQRAADDIDAIYNRIQELRGGAIAAGPAVDCQWGIDPDCTHLWYKPLTERAIGLFTYAAFKFDDDGVIRNINPIGIPDWMRANMDGKCADFIFEEVVLG